MSHKSYKITLWFIAEKHFFKQETVRILNKKIKIADFKIETENQNRK